MTKDKRIELMIQMCAALIQAKPEVFLTEEGSSFRYKEGGTWWYPVIDAAEVLLSRIEEAVNELEKINEENRD